MLMYHGVVEKFTEPLLERNFHLLNEFEYHIKQLSKKYHIVSADEFDNYLKAGKNLDNIILITFDDGYRNNLLAAEILNKYKCPYIVFAATRHIGSTTRSIWTVELSINILKAPIKHIELFDTKFDLSTESMRIDSFTQIRRKLKKMDAADKNKHLQYITQQLPSGFIESMIEKLPQFQLCNWDECRQISNALGYIGSHGVDHELHTDFESEETIANEIINSTKDIELNVGQRPEFFAYPNGNHSPISYKYLGQCGYKQSFTTALGTVLPHDKPYLLSRVTPTRKLMKFSYQMHKIDTEY